MRRKCHKLDQNGIQPLMPKQRGKDHCGHSQKCFFPPFYMKEMWGQAVLHCAQMRIRSRDFKIQTDKNSPLCFIYPRKLQKKVLKERSITPRSPLAPKWRHWVHSLAGALVGSPLETAEDGSILPFQKLHSPWISPYAFFLPQGSQVTQMNTAITARSLWEQSFKGSQVEDHNHFLLLHLA